MLLMNVKCQQSLIPPLKITQADGSKKYQSTRDQRENKATYGFLSDKNSAKLRNYFLIYLIITSVPNKISIVNNYGLFP